MENLSTQADSTLHTVVHQSPVLHPKVSVILLDWSVRESFHSLTYLNRQREPRENYELIWIEYYGHRSEQLANSLSEDSQNRIDQWIVLGMPEHCYYHKHMMYNVGIAVSRGDIVCICDSDAIFAETFIGSVISTFAENERIVLHIDEVRNNDKKFYPFSYPSISEVLGPGAINWHDGKTTGLWDATDPLHTRNYGACFCAKRRELIAIGGADEHLGFVGHVCGPYDMTFRLVNNGCREIWHETEYIYHTWHPGQAGDQNLLGPHDGRHVSTIALDAARDGRVPPLKENSAIAALRDERAPEIAADLVELAIDPTYQQLLVEEQLEQTSMFARWRHLEMIASLDECRYNIIRLDDLYYGVPWDLGELDAGKVAMICTRPGVFSGATADAVREQIEMWSAEAKHYSTINRLIESGSRIYRTARDRIGRFLFHG